MVENLVLIDTCIWVPFFNQPQSPEKYAVDGLLEEDRGALVGPLVAEILLGFRRDPEADWVASFLRGLHYMEVNWEAWRSTAHLGRQMASRGHELPLSDLVVAAMALRSDSAVYSTDPHFDLIPGLKRFLPK